MSSPASSSFTREVSMRPLPPLLVVLLSGCSVDWCARFNFDCTLRETFEPPASNDRDDDQWPDSEDCDDGDATIHPSAEELCDGIDNDCDGVVDDGWEFSTYYADDDGDGWGDPERTVVTCGDSPRGVTTRPGDCDDTDSQTHPDAADRCDGVDRDCDGVLAGCGSPVVESGTLWFAAGEGVASAL